MPKDTLIGTKGQASKQWLPAVLLILCIVLVIFAIVANIILENYRTIITTYFDQTISRRIETRDVRENTVYFPSEFDSVEELAEAGSKLGKQIADEGIVLLHNDEAFLPLDPGVESVSLFGIGSFDFLYSGGGSGGSVTSEYSLMDSFLDNGFRVNPVLWEFYDDSRHQRRYAGLGAGSFEVDEVPREEYSDDVRSSFADYNDLAVVVFTRVGSEGIDLTLQLEENLGNPEGEGYLSITQNERDLMQMIQDSNEFSDIVVIINSTNTMELAWMEDYDKIRATLLVQGVGANGILSIADIMDGSVNPSARLVDTFAFDSQSAPSAQNFGDMAFTNSEFIVSGDAGVPYANAYGVDLGNKYIVFQEGIYVGYRYYETRYEDFVMGSGNAGTYDYSETVHYPFGYGLSYTSFEQRLDELVETPDGYEAVIIVTNTGGTAGKDIVQLYFQPPFTEFDREYGIEKASIELIGFDKTIMLEPGQSETLLIQVNRSELKTYASEFDDGTYIIDEGDYLFTIGSDAHDALNNILAYKGYSPADGMTTTGDPSQVYSVYNDFDGETFDVSEYTGVEIRNLFEDADSGYYDQPVTYLSRTDWSGTFPQPVELEANEQMLRDMRPLDSLETDHTYVMPVTDAQNGTTVIQAMGQPFDAPVWEDILDNLTFNDMNNLIQLGGFAIQAIDSIAMDRTSEKDGPAGLNSNYSGGNLHAMAYPSETMIAQTWDVELIERMGNLVAEDALNAERSSNGSPVIGWYAPGVNIHRSPYSGRNFEYFSEDPFISGAMVEAETRAVSDKGIIAYVKHYALNDVETNRIMLLTFANEQSIREIYAYPFEKAMTTGQAKGIMTSLNRIGAVYASADEGLINGLLRGEWGFEQIVKTDFAEHYTGDDSYYNAIASLKAGTDSFLNTNRSLSGVDPQYADNAQVVNLMRNAAHRILYTAANSAAMNGMSSTTIVRNVLAPWEITMIILDALVLLLTIVAVVFFMKSRRRRNIKVIHESTK